MLMRDNLIRLYFLYNGSFDGINSCSFMTGPEVDLDYLYEVLGFNAGLGEHSPKDVYDLRKEFVVNSYNPNYRKNLMTKYKANSNSELVDILLSKNILGLERRHISVLGEFKNCGIPSKFINQKISHALDLLEAKLNYSTYNGNKLVDYRRDLLLTPPAEVNNVISSYRIDLDYLFKVRFYDDNVSRMDDNVLYMSKVDGYSEEEVREILFRCYLLGLPKVPLYLRKIFVESLPGTISLNDLYAIHNLIDISNMSKCSVKDLLNSFRFNFIEPEDMYRRFGGFFSFSENMIYFSNPSSESFYKFSIKDFVDAYNHGKLFNFNIDRNLVLDEMQDDSDDGGVTNDRSYSGDSNTNNTSKSMSKSDIKDSRIFG